MDNQKRSILQNLLMTPEETEAYGNPSIMDDYIKRNDPEQWEKILSARNTQDAMSLGMGTAGALKTPGKGLMGKFGPIRKSVGESKGQLPKEIYNKAIGHLTPEKPNIGKVTQKEVPEEAIGKVTNVADDEALSLMERIKKMEDTLDYDERFQRLNELLKQKKAQKGE